MVDPGAMAGRDANLLLLGDEQSGRLVQILEDLGEKPFPVTAAFRYEGMVLRLNERTVVISRADQRAWLSSSGLNDLRFEPLSLRKIYSPAYDRFLSGYFGSARRRDKAVASHLFFTSRGCGNECSICCSGGFQPFAALTPERVTACLRKFAEHEVAGEAAVLGRSMEKWEARERSLLRSAVLGLPELLRWEDEMTKDLEVFRTRKMQALAEKADRTPKRLSEFFKILTRIQRADSSGG